MQLVKHKFEIIVIVCKAYLPLLNGKILKSINIYKNILELSMLFLTMESNSSFPVWLSKIPSIVFSSPELHKASIIGHT